MSAPDSDAVVLAAGASLRMGGQDKMLTPLAGVPLLLWSLAAFERAPSVRRVVVTASARNTADITAALGASGLSKPAAVIDGGPSRAHSVLAALEAIEAGGAAYVAVHDGARPFLTPEIVETGIALAREGGAAVAAVPSPDTVKLVGGKDGLVSETPVRDRTWLAQTPQVARLTDLLASHRRHRADLERFTDDASLLEADGIPVRVFQSTPDNFKVTALADLERAQALALRLRDEGRLPADL